MQAICVKSDFAIALSGAEAYNWCTVEHKGWDAILFAGIAVVVACLSQGPYSSLIVLVAGEHRSASTLKHS